MALPRTSKEKSARVDWGYHARPDSLSRNRRALWLFAAVVMALPLFALTIVAALSTAPPGPLAVAASRGPLASVHAAWDQQCEACHTPFQPINGDRWFPRLLGENSSHPITSNAKCEACHAGSSHHPNVKPESVGGCVDCHRDHQGRTASLVHLADATCTHCHARLADHATSLKSANSPAITGFAEGQGHPEFRAVADPKSHPRTWKFSHAVHLAPGMNVGSGYTFADIPDAAERKRYMVLFGEKNPNTAVKLDCVACHQLDAARSQGAADTLTRQEEFSKQTSALLHGLPKEPLQPPRAAGKYYLPVNFEMHCRACHPLTFDETPGLRTRHAPHRVQPDELDRFLREVYSARYIADQLPPLPESKREPGRLDPRPADFDDTSRKLAQGKIAEQVRRAKEMLFVGQRTCQECHAVQLPNPADAVAQGHDPRFPTQILPAQLPTVWQPRARFDHSAHRAMKCVDCHPGTGRTVEQERTAAIVNAPPGSAQPHYQHSPDLPGIATCRTCHAPARSDGDGRSVAGVRHGCTDCHTYHHADRTLQGLGSPHRDPVTRRTLEELLRGRDIPGK